MMNPEKSYALFVRHVDTEWKRATRWNISPEKAIEDYKSLPSSDITEFFDTKIVERECQCVERDLDKPTKRGFAD